MKKRNLSEMTGYRSYEQPDRKMLKIEQPVALNEQHRLDALRAAGLDQSGTRQAIRYRAHQKLRNDPLYQFALQQNPNLPNQPVSKLKELMRQRNVTTARQKLRVVQLSNQGLGTRKIAQITGVRQYTVVRVLSKYKESGDIFDKRGKHDRPKKINDALASFLLDETLVELWAPLNLLQRCQKIRELEGIGVELSRSTLGNFYRKNKIRYKVARQRFWTAVSKEDLFDDRVNFINVLIPMLRTERVFFMDETTSNLWDLPHRCWQKTDASVPFSFERAKKKGYSVTVIGSISNFGEFHHFVTDGGKAANIKSYFDDLKVFLKGSLAGIVLVMDNLDSHVKYESWLISEGVRPLFLPKCTSWFNPIEQLWNYMKSLFGKALCMVERELQTELWMSSKLHEICQTVAQDPEYVKRFQESTLTVMRRFLEENQQDFSVFDENS